MKRTRQNQWLLVDDQDAELARARERGDVCSCGREVAGVLERRVGTETRIRAACSCCADAVGVLAPWEPGQ